MRATKKFTGEVANAMARAATWYQKRPGADELSKRSTEWAKVLAPFPIGTVEEAFDLARQESPEWYPTLGKLETACKRVVARRRQQVEKERREEQEAQESAEHNAYIRGIPNDHDAQEQWIADAPNACERLGREWSVDSKRAGRTANDVLPDHVVKQRIARLIAAMGD